MTVSTAMLETRRRDFKMSTIKDNYQRLKALFSVLSDLVSAASRAR